MVMSLAPPGIVQPTARTRTLNDENKNGFTDSFNRQCLPPHRYPSFSSPAPSDSATSPRQPQTSDAHHARHAAIPPTDGGGDVRGSEEIELRFRFDTIELTLPPPPASRRGRRVRR